jgi:hypothetical protein
MYSHVFFHGKLKPLRHQVTTIFFYYKNLGWGDDTSEIGW